jgi:hypothetical protein
VVGERAVRGVEWGLNVGRFADHIGADVSRPACALWTEGAVEDQAPIQNSGDKPTHQCRPRKLPRTAYLRHPNCCWLVYGWRADWPGVRWRRLLKPINVNEFGAAPLGEPMEQLRLWRLVTNVFGCVVVRVGHIVEALSGGEIHFAIGDAFVL